MSDSTLNGHSSRLRRAAFLDRDGVINEDRGFVHKIDDFVFVPGAVEALHRLQASDYLLVVITNQSGIARGLYTECDYLTLTRYMKQQLLERGVTLDAVEYCPHLTDAPVARYRLDCDCRKPRSGMITRTKSALGIDLRASILVGDRASDIEAGRQAGVGRCFLVQHGYSYSTRDAANADAVYNDLAACTADICTGTVARNRVD